MPITWIDSALSDPNSALKQFLENGPAPKTDHYAVLGLDSSKAMNADLLQAAYDDIKAVINDKTSGVYVSKDAMFPLSTFF